LKWGETLQREPTAERPLPILNGELGFWKQVGRKEGKNIYCNRGGKRKVKKLLVV